MRHPFARSVMQSGGLAPPLKFIAEWRRNEPLLCSKYYLNG